MEHVLDNVISANNPGSLTLEAKDFDDDSRLIEGIYKDNVGIYCAGLYTAKGEEEIFPCGPASCLHQDISYLLTRYGHRNTYLNTESIGDIGKEYGSSDTGFNQADYQLDFERIRSGIHDEKYKPFMVKYLETIATLEQLLQFTGYMHSNKWTSKEFTAVFPNIQTPRYSLTKVDRELINMLRNPEKNIEMLKSKLTLDEDTGFYVNKDGIAYLCLHEFMLYEGKTIKSMLEACADSTYCCKYCKSPLTYNLDAETIDFTPLQYRAVYIFIEILNIVSYEEFIGQVIISAISKSLDKIELSADNIVPMSEAFTATYLYKLYTYLQDKVKMLNADGFIKFINHLWNKSGWDEETVSTLMENEERFDGFVHCCDIIISFKETTQITMETIVDILLKNVEGEGNPIQKMYLSDKSKLGIMTDLIIKAANNYIQLIQLPEILKEKIDLQRITIYLYLTSGTQLKPFYMNVWEYMCPVDGYHTFSGGKCKACGIDKDNVEKIFTKYEKEIRELITPPKTKMTKQKTSTRQIVIDAINKSPSTKPDILKDILLTDEYNDKLRDKLEQLVHIGKITEIPRTKENNCKILNYLISSPLNIESIQLELDALIIHASATMSKLITVF